MGPFFLVVWWARGVGVEGDGCALMYRPVSHPVLYWCYIMTLCPKMKAFGVRVLSRIVLYEYTFFTFLFRVVRITLWSYVV